MSRNAYLCVKTTDSRFKPDNPNWLGKYFIGNLGGLLSKLPPSTTSCWYSFAMVSLVLIIGLVCPCLWTYCDHYKSIIRVRWLYVYSEVLSGLVNSVNSGGSSWIQIKLAILSFKALQHGLGSTRYLLTEQTTLYYLKQHFKLSYVYVYC